MPDGLHFVTANNDGTVAIRDMDSGEFVRSWYAHTPWGANALALTPCGARIVSCGGDGIKLWDAQTGRKLRSFHEPAGHVRALAMTPDGTRIVCANSDAMIAVLDIRRGCTLASMNVLEALQAHGIARPPGQPPMICAVAVTRDGRRVLSGGYDNTVWIWDIESGKALNGLNGHGNWIWGLAQTQDGLIASASADGTLRLWAPRDTPDNDGPIGRSDMSCLLSSDAGMIVTGTEGGRIRIRNAESGEPMREWQAHDDEGVMSLAMTVDSRVIVSGGTLGSVQVWETQTGRRIRSLAQGRKLRAGSRWYEKECCVERLRITPEGYAVAVGKSSKAWNLLTGRRVWISNRAEGEEGLIGRRYVLQKRNEGGRLAQVFRRGGGSSAFVEIPLSRRLLPAIVAFSPDGRRVVLRGSEERVEVWDIEKRAKLATLAEPARERMDPDPAADSPAVAGTTEIQVSPDNRRIFTAGDRVVRAWDSQSFDLLWTAYAGPGICCSPDGSHLLAGDCVLDSATGRVLAQAPSHCLTYTRHGRILATDQLQNYSIHALRNFQVGSELATPFASGEILCPHCMEGISRAQADAGLEIECPDCGKRVRLNPFSYCDKYRPVSAIEFPIPKILSAVAVGATVWLLFERIWNQMGRSTPSLHGMALAWLAAALYLLAVLRSRGGRKTGKKRR
jgi:WD40 repeat protein